MANIKQQSTLWKSSNKVQKIQRPARALEKKVKKASRQKRNLEKREKKWMN
jgi:hypothetical protein